MNGSCRLPFCGPADHAEEVRVGGKWRELGGEWRELGGSCGSRRREQKGSGWK